MDRAYAILVLGVSIFCSAVCTSGRELQAQPPVVPAVESGEYDTPSGQPWTGWTAPQLNLTITAQNDTKTAQLHSQSQDTSNIDCLLSDARNPNTQYPGPLIVGVPSGQTSRINFLQTNNHRYQYQGYTGFASGFNVVVEEINKTPLYATYAGLPGQTGSPGTVLFGVYAGSDATAHCLVNVTFTSVGNSAVPPTVTLPILAPPTSAPVSG